MTIVEHRATTYPTFDPMWYAPVSIVLAAVEVDTAMLCASVPVFWPVLRDGWGKIFVTKEVNVSHERRIMVASSDDLELRRTRSSSVPHFSDFIDVRSCRTETTVKSGLPLPSQKQERDWSHGS